MSSVGAGIMASYDVQMQGVSPYIWGSENIYRADVDVECHTYDSVAEQTHVALGIGRDVVAQVGSPGTIVLSTHTKKRVLEMKSIVIRYIHFRHVDDIP
jgi:hypothetical protein